MRGRVVRVLEGRPAPRRAAPLLLGPLLPDGVLGQLQSDKSITEHNQSINIYSRQRNAFFYLKNKAKQITERHGSFSVMSLKPFGNAFEKEKIKGETGKKEKEGRDKGKEKKWKAIKENYIFFLKF